MLGMSMFILVSGWVLFALWVLASTPSLILTLWRSLDSVVARMHEPAGVQQRGQGAPA